MSSALLVLSLTVSTVMAVSSGLVDICNALSPVFGCTNFKDGDRAQCLEKGQIMEWVTKPKVDNTLFELFAGDEKAKVTTYTPGTFLKVSLRTKKYDSQYRGILLYAIDAADTSSDPAKLGRFEFSDTQDLFHSYCPGTVLHAGAALKPYLTSWRYLPPADFAGTIKFVALIKVGPANKGEFYYPNTLTLTKQGDAPTLMQKWFEGTLNKSCDEVCTAVDRNLECNDAKITAVNSAAKVESMITPYVTCRTPYLARCTTLGLSTDAAGFCYYPNQAECTAADMTTAAAVATCATKSATDKISGRRICPCACKAGATCATPVASTAASTPKATRITTAPTTTTTTVVGGTPMPTLAPACTARPGCQCGEGGDCATGYKCTLQGNMGFCLAPKTCTFGELGCPCSKTGDACSASLECKEDLCVRKADDQCTDGNLGCPCTNLCQQDEVKCMKKPDAESGFCALAVQPEDVCQAGTAGCPCQQGGCSQDLTCRVIGKSELCVDMRVFVDNSQIAATNMLALSAFATVVAMIVSMF